VRLSDFLKILKIAKRMSVSHFTNYEIASGVFVGIFVGVFACYVPTMYDIVKNKTRNYIKSCVRSVYDDLEKVSGKNATLERIETTLKCQTEKIDNVYRELSSVGGCNSDLSYMSLDRLYGVGFSDYSQYERDHNKPQWVSTSLLPKPATDVSGSKARPFEYFDPTDPPANAPVNVSTRTVCEASTGCEKIKASSDLLSMFENADIIPPEILSMFESDGTINPLKLSTEVFENPSPQLVKFMNSTLGKFNHLTSNPTTSTTAKEEQPNPIVPSHDLRGEVRSDENGY
jgi:hypothetical protein